jgi:transposase InsO family protein
MAVKRQGLDCQNENLITHSDRGSQYASEEYRDKLKSIKSQQVCLEKETAMIIVL